MNALFGIKAKQLFPLVTKRKRSQQASSSQGGMLANLVSDNMDKRKGFRKRRNKDTVSVLGSLGADTSSIVNNDSATGPARLGVLADIGMARPDPIRRKRKETEDEVTSVLAHTLGEGKKVDGPVSVFELISEKPPARKASKPEASQNVRRKKQGRKRPKVQADEPIQSVLALSVDEGKENRPKQRKRNTGSLASLLAQVDAKKAQKPRQRSNYSASSEVWYDCVENYPQMCVIVETKPKDNPREDADAGVETSSTQQPVNPFRIIQQESKPRRPRVRKAARRSISQEVVTLASKVLESFRTDNIVMGVSGTEGKPIDLDDPGARVVEVENIDVSTFEEAAAFTLIELSASKDDDNDGGEGEQPDHHVPIAISTKDSLKSSTQDEEVLGVAITKKKKKKQVGHRRKLAVKSAKRNQKHTRHDTKPAIIKKATNKWQSTGGISQPIRRSKREAVETQRYAPPEHATRQHRVTYQVEEDSPIILLPAEGKVVMKRHSKRLSGELALPKVLKAPEIQTIEIANEGAKDSAMKSLGRRKSSRAKAQASCYSPGKHSKEPDAEKEDDFFEDREEMKTSGQRKSSRAKTQATRYSPGKHSNGNAGENEDDFFEDREEMEALRRRQQVEAKASAKARVRKQAVAAEEQPPKASYEKPRSKTQKQPKGIKHPQVKVKNAAKDALKPDQDGWTGSQIASLRTAYESVDPLSSDFWEEIASQVVGMDDEQCRKKWFALVQTPAAKKKAREKAIQKVEEGNNTRYEEDDLFNATPMKSRLFGDTSKRYCNVLFDIDVGSPIVDGGFVAAANMHTEYDDGIEEEAAPISRLGYKSYIQNLKRGITKAEKENRKRKSRPKNDRGPRVLSDRVDQGDLEVKGSLTPGGTVRLQTVDWNESEDDFFGSDDEE